LLLQEKREAAKYQCGIFVHSYTLKLQEGGFCETLVPGVATPQYHNSKEFNPNADSLETFKSYVIVATDIKSFFHRFSFPGEYKLIFLILNIIPIIPKVNQHLRSNKIDQSSVPTRLDIGTS
jgi:hypothetical protein